MPHSKSHPLADQTVVLNDKVATDPRGIIKPGVQFTIRDWVDCLGDRESWQSIGNWATAHYAERQSMSDLPDDEEVIYGKINGLGHCVHQTELDLGLNPKGEML